MVYLGAWGCGKPVIACDIPALRELVSPGEDGLLVSKDQKPEEIAEAINCLLGNPTLRKRMGQKGQNNVQQHYSWDQVADNMIGLYSDLLNAHNG